MDAETRTVVRSALDASAYTAGAAQVAAANERMAQSGETVVRTQEAAEGTARRKATAIERLQASLDQTYRAQQQFERAQTQINAALERGAISAQRAAELQQLAQQRYLGAGAAANTLAAANDNATRSTGRFGQVIGQAGFQVQDFASQVMAGGNALVALGQQGSQLLGIFGVGGAIAGAALTVGILAYQLIAVSENSAAATRSAEQGFDGMRRAADDLKKVIAEVNDLFLTQEQRAANARNAVIGELSARLRQQADIALQFQEESASQLAQAERQLQAAQRRQEQARREAERARRGGGMAPQDELRAAEAALFTAQARLDGLNADIARQSRVLGEVQAQQRRLAEATAESPEETRRREEAERRERERRAEAERREAERREREGERRTQAEEREAERTRQRQAAEEERARQAREREAERAREREAQAINRQTDEIVRYGADAFADMFEENSRGWRGMLDTFEATFRRTFARMAAEAIIRPIVQPIVAGLIGQPGSEGTMMGGLTSLLGLSGMGSQISGALGLSGMGAGVAGLMATPIMAGSAGLSVGGLSGAGGLAALEAAGGAAAASGGFVTLGSVLGPAALGALGGGLVAQMTGGNTTGGAIGGGLGAAAGFMIGGPVGALIGGAAGGGLGGLIGPRSGPGFFHLNVAANDNGLLSITGAGEKRAGEQLAALQRQTEQELAALNQQIRALGLTVSGSATLGSDRADPNRAGNLAAAAGQFRLTAQDARIQAAIDRAGQGLNALGAAQDAAAFAAQLDAMRRSMEDADDPIGAIRRQFDGMREAAQRLGFGLDEVNAAQERAIRQAEEQRRQAERQAEEQRRQAAAGTAAGLIGGIADFARSLRTANDNSGNPLSRLSAAEAQFSSTIAAALSGDTRALGRVTQDAQTFRGLSRDVFGTGQGFADAEARIVGALEQIGLVGDDRLTASALAAETRDQTETLVAALARLQDEVAALRREARQAGSNPLTARAA